MLIKTTGYIYLMKEELSRPVISAIIERVKKGKKQILVMTRWKPNSDPIYSGTLEIPAGHIDAFENVYDTVKREVLEETGLKVTKIKPEIKTKTHSPNDDGSFAFVPLCCQQQLKNGKPWIGFVFICEVEDKEPIPNLDEVKDIKWMDYEKLKELFEKHPRKIFTLQLGALDFYFNYRECQE
jgi:8-oxo-dGTP pyrophosphatase MutT (NUDIX family)